MRGSPTTEAYMSSWAQEKGIGIWVFKGEEENSQQDEKSKCLVNKCLPYHADKSDVESYL